MIGHDPDRYEDFDFDQDDGLDEDGNPVFECPRFRVAGGGWHCPLVGTEECDWDCPE